MKQRSHRLLSVLASIAVAATTWAVTAGSAPPSALASTTVDWTQFRESQTHQGNNPEVGTALTTSTVSGLAIAWTGATGGAVDSSPATTGGVVYVGSSDGFLYAYSVGCGTNAAACSPIWKGATGGAVTSSPAVSLGYVFVGSADGKVYAFKVGCATGGATCSPVWTAATGGAIDSSPSLSGSVLYIGSADGKIYAFDATGGSGSCSGTPKTCTPLWTGATGGAIHSSPAESNGVTYVGSDDGKLYAFSTTCGTGGASCDPLWTATTGGAIHSSPSVASGRVYVGSNSGTFYAVDAAGSTNCGGSPVSCTPLWTAATGGAVTASAAEGLSRVWIASEDGKLYSFTNCGSSGAACTPEWTGNVGHPIDSSPAYSDHVLYIGAGDGKVYAFQADCPTATCTPLWTSSAIGTAIKSSPAVTTGFVYVGSNDGKLYAFHLPVDRLVLTPATATIAAGALQTYSAEGFNASNQDQGDVTIATTFTISGSGTCSGSSCGSAVPGTYTVTGTYGTATGTATLTVVAGGSDYFPLTPTRILDTRIGLGLSDHFRSHVARTFQVSGKGGVPANATGVTGNLTVTEQTALGFLFVGPVAQNNPTSSTLNFPVNDARANGVDVALAADGTLSVTYASPVATATTQVIFDVTGYFLPSTSGTTFHGVAPTRLLDTRIGLGLSGKMATHVGRTFQVTGSTIPSNATAVTGNLTVTQQSSLGYFEIGPVLTNDPTSSTLNFPLNDDRANNVTVALGAGGTLSITFVSPTPGQSAHAIFDVTGYFTPDATGTKFYPLAPARLLDSRPGGTGLSGAFQSHVGRTFQVTGSIVPASAVAVTGNLTVTQQTNLGFLYAGPTNMNQPTSSNLNFPINDDRANGMTAMLGAGGTLSATYAAPTSGPTAQVIFDVSGYFAP